MAQASASYSVAVQDAHGKVSLWMWNCETCPGAGVAPSEQQAIKEMNTHVEDLHPQHHYVATPIPE